MVKRAKGDRLWEVQNLTPKLRAVLRRHVDGQRGIDIARAMGLSRTYVSYIINSRISQIEIRRMEEKREDESNDRWSKLSKIDEKAIDLVEKIIDQGIAAAKKGDIITPSQIKAAIDHLNRRGYTTPTQINVQQTHIATSKVIAKLKERHEQLKQDRPKEIIQDAIVEGGQVSQDEEK